MTDFNSQRQKVLHALQTGLGLAGLYLFGFISVLQAVGLSYDVAGFLTVCGLLLGGGFLIGGLTSRE